MKLVAASGRRTKIIASGVAVAAALTLTLGACSSNNNPNSTGSGSGSTDIKVALILKELTNPYFVTMSNDAKTEASSLGVTLQVTAGTSDSDTTSQINQINQAVAAGFKGIIITTNGDAVNAALNQAKTAGLLVVALDTAPNPPTTADVTYATDNHAAGLIIGQWMAATLAGKAADIAMLDDLDNEVVSVDVMRDHGFLDGMGIAVGDPNVNGKEATSGSYTGGKGGTYNIACQLATQGSQSGGQSAMETCLAKDPNINVVYTINEPSAQGAVTAIKSAGKSGQITVVTIDGGCSNLSFIKSGDIGATAAQFPGKMASMGVQAVANFAKTGTKASNAAGQSFFDTGTQLYTDSPAAGVTSVTSTAAASTCWGS